MSIQPMLNDLINRRGISMKTTRVGSNPVVVDGSDMKGLDHFKCSLYSQGEQVDVYLSVQHEADTLTLSEVLYMLAMDASGCEMMEGLDQFRDQWTEMFGGSDGNLKELENFWHEYRLRCKQTEEFRKFLGRSTYNELLKKFDEGENPLDEYTNVVSKIADADLQL
jgi:hypothetical protein